MKKNVYIIIGAGMIVVIGGWLILFNGFWQASVEENNDILGTVEKEVVLSINDGEKEPINLTVSFVEGMTAFDLLKNESEKLSLNLETETYDTGIFIKTIGDKENGQDNNYWLYYINGEMPTVSSDKIVIKSGDKVEFKFEKSPF